MKKIKEYAIEHVDVIIAYTASICAAGCGFVIGYLFGLDAGWRR